MHHPGGSAPDMATGGTEDGRALECPEYLEGDRIRGLLEQLQHAMHAGRPIKLMAGNARRISTLALQVVAAARATAQRLGTPFSVVSPSPEFQRACADTGLLSLLSQGD